MIRTKPGTKAPTSVPDSAIAQGILDDINTRTLCDDTPSLLWPKRIWIITYSTEPIKHGCYCFKGIHGIACFRKRDAAAKFATFVQNAPSQVWKADLLSFEEACDLVKSKTAPINSLILVDAKDAPLVFAVKALDLPQ